MVRKGDYAYAQNEDLELVELRYTNAPSSMYIIKAKASNTSIQALEAKITSERLIQLARSRFTRKVNLQVPPFEIRLPTKLTDILKQMGLADLFNNGADFSRMDPDNNLKVNDLVHEAYIKVGCAVSVQ
jgi:serine protease inhibitor